MINLKKRVRKEWHELTLEEKVNYNQYLLKKPGFKLTGAFAGFTILYLIVVFITIIGLLSLTTHEMVKEEVLTLS